ncbi:MAG: transketolase, partial [Candidatus Omnitrophota bacterium]
WEAFGWDVIDADGHDPEILMDALDKAESVKGKPTVILCCTTKGKGVSFIENKAEWHGVAPKKDELKKALEELDKENAKL